MEVDDPVFPRRLYTVNEEPIPVKSIGYYSNDTRLFNALHEVLTEDEWEELSNSRLGVLLKFSRLEFGWASRLVHYILGMQLDVKRKYEIWSLVGVTPIRFSLNEFEEYTGLNCEYVHDLEEPEGEVEVTDEISEFWTKLGLGVESAPSIDDLTLACASAAEWSREDRIRLGYLAMYAGFIEARKPSAPVRLSLARMVFHLEAFENYPWGRLAFLNLIESVKTRDLCKAYTIEGFVEVLQIWIYKALPGFGNVYGKPFHGKPTPALLGFEGSRGRKYVRSNMIKQSRFRMMVMKEREFINPRWDDDNEDPAVENIIRAAFQELGHGQWRWLKKHWLDQGVLINTQTLKGKVELKQESNESVLSDDGSRKRARTTPPDGSIAESFVDVIKNHIDLALRVLETDVLIGFEKLEMEMKNLNTKVDEIDERLRDMSLNDGGKKNGEHEGEPESKQVTEPTHRVSSNPSSPKKSAKKPARKPAKRTTAMFQLMAPRMTRARTKLDNPS